MRLSVFLFCIVVTAFNSMAQDNSIIWQRTIGGSFDDDLDIIIETNDGGYLAASTSNSNISGDKTEDSNGFDDFWIVKLNVSGDIEWQNTIGGSSEDALYDVLQTLDGGYLLSGKSASDISGDKSENSRGFDDYWIIKVDSSGAVEWDKTIGGDRLDILGSVVQTSDGSYVLGGTSISDISGEKTENSNGEEDYWVLKLDANGVIIWQNTIGGSNRDWLHSLIEISDGGYLLGGQSRSPASGDKTEDNWGSSTDFWIVKIDSNGAVLWDNTIGGTSTDQLFTMIESADGGFVLGGNSSSPLSGDKTEGSQGGLDFWVVKVNDQGAIEWQNTIGGDGQDDLRCIIQFQNGNYLLAGPSRSNAVGDKLETSLNTDYWIVEIDENNGSIVRQNTYRGFQYDGLWSVLETSNSEIVLGGLSESNAGVDKAEDSRGLRDMWIIKISDVLEVIDEEVGKEVLLFPNPASQHLFIEYGGGFFDNIRIYSSLGIFIEELSYVKSINVAHLPTGVYYLEFCSASKCQTKKLIKV